MFGSSYAEFVQGSAVKTWDCVAHFASLLWYKFIHLKDPIMPRSRRRHHSRSRSRSRSHSHDRDREPKRRKIESFDSPHHRRSVSSKPEAIDCETDDYGIDELDVQTENSISNNAIEKSSEKFHSNNIKTTNENDKSSPAQDVKSDSDMKEDNDQLLEDNGIQNLKPSSHASNKDISESEKLSLSSNNKDNNSDCEILESTESNEEESKGSGQKSSEKESDEDLNKSAIEDTQLVDSSNEETIKNNTSGKLKEKAKDLNIIPKKVLSPKQLQKRLESEKKRLEKQKEKEERDRAKLEEKKKITEEKLRIKQEKEEQKNKERMAKDDKKKKEQEERDKKRREKEEKDEQKKKEREQEKLKKQQEMEEKIKEKQKLEEQKQKTAAAFVNFFVPKKSDSAEERKTEESSNFMPFEVKSDMRLAPVSRKYLEGVEKLEFERKIENPDSNTKLYLDELKQGKEVGKFGKTWRFEDVDPDDEVIIVEENVGETIVEQKPKVEKMRAKFFKFSENQRPPYFGTFKKRSKIVTARRPLGKDSIFNYEIDSDEEWDDEGEGESLKGTDDEDEKDNESDNDYEVDNDVFVPHGHLSGDERDDEENVKFSPESHKAKLKLLKNEFDEEMKSKLQRIKPRVIGCIWYDKTKSNVEEAIDKYLQPFAIICNGQIQIKKRSEFALASHKKVPKQLSKEHVPTFLKFIHGSVDQKKNIVKCFTEHMRNNGIQLDVSGYGLVKQMKNFAQWQKCPEEGAMHKKMCWYVGEDIRKEYNVNLVLPNKMNRKRR